MPAATSPTITRFNPVPLDTPAGGEVQVTVVSGDTLYYADNPNVTSSNNQGTLTAGQSRTFVAQTWIVSASFTSVTIATASAAPDISVHLAPSGLDDSAAMANAMANASQIVLAPGTFLWNSQIPAFQRNTPCKIIGAGIGETIIRLSAAVPRAFDFNKVADYDTFSQITLRDLTVDANNVATGGHIVLGTNQAGVTQTRINLDQITVENVTFVNAPVAGRVGIQLSVNHAAASETQTNITNITVRGVRGFGGECLVLISGGGIVTTGLNVFIDHVFISDWYHSLLTAPTGFVAATHIQIGSFAFGGEDIYVGPGYGEFSGDDGIEINAVQHAIVDGVVIKDSWNQGFRLTNFGTPQNLTAQRVEYRNCRFIKSAAGNLPAGSGKGWSFPVAATNINPPSIVLNDCAYYRGTAEAPQASEAITFPGAAGFGSPSVRIKNFRAVADQINVSSGVTTGSMMDLNAQGPACQIDVDGFYAKFSGAATGATPVTSAIRLANATSLSGRIVGVVSDFNLTGAGSNTLTGINVGISGSALTITTLEIAGLVLQTMTGDAAAHGVTLRGTGFVTVSGLVSVHDCDLALASAGNEVAFFVDTASNVNKVRARSNRWHTTPAPVALAGLVTATGIGSGKPYSVLAVFTQGSGAAITAIDFSTNGGTTYTNFLTQASGALPAGFDQTLGPLTSDALLRATFTTTQPTITLVPVDP